MLEIFAKFNTDENVLCGENLLKEVKLLKRLNEEFGGDWICVDEVLTGGDIKV